MNRRTLESANLECSASPLGRFLVTLRAKLRGAWEWVSSRRRYWNLPCLAAAAGKRRARELVAEKVPWWQGWREWSQAVCG